MKITEAIATRLTNLGNGINNAIEKQIAWNKENIETGLLPDEEKVRLLKYQLYRDVRAGKDTQELRKTIALLSNEINKGKDYEKSFVGLLNSVCSFWILAGASTIAISLLVTSFGCPFQSKFCADTSNISNSITKYFVGE